MAFVGIIGSCNAQTEKQSSEEYKGDVTNHTEQVENKQGKLMNFMTNDDIDYAIVLRLDTTTAPFSSNYRVSVENITETDIEKFKKIPMETWLQLLEDENTDWAANLILYDIYERDAALLARHVDQNRWREYMKYEDIDYWKDMLNKKALVE